MERLTSHFDYCDYTECRHYDKELAKKDNCNFIHSSRNQCLEYAVYNKLREYEDLDEQELLLKLPCKIGDTVYSLTAFCEICERCLDNENSCEVCSQGDFVTETKFDYKMIRMFGKTVFLTKEEAEKKLAEMEM